MTSSTISDQMLSKKSINVFGQRYKIKYINNLEYADEGVEGLCHRQGKLVEIEKSLSKKKKFHTMIHELGHAIFEEVGINCALDDEIEEIIVESYSKFLGKFLNELL